MRLATMIHILRLVTEYLNSMSVKYAVNITPEFQNEATRLLESLPKDDFSISLETYVHAKAVNLHSLKIFLLLARYEFQLTDSLDIILEKLCNQ